MDLDIVLEIAETLTQFYNNGSILLKYIVSHNKDVIIYKSYLTLFRSISFIYTNWINKLVHTWNILCIYVSVLSSMLLSLHLLSSDHHIPWLYYSRIIIIILLFLEFCINKIIQYGIFWGWIFILKTLSDSVHSSCVLWQSF